MLFLAKKKMLFFAKRKIFLGLEEDLLLGPEEDLLVDKGEYLLICQEADLLLSLEEHLIRHRAFARRHGWAAFSCLVYGFLCVVPWVVCVFVFVELFWWGPASS